MDQVDLSMQKPPYPVSDLRDDLKKQILMNYTGSRSSYNQIPMVHGRSVGSKLDATGTIAGGPKNGRMAGKTRLSSHQRNLSLDFR